MIKRMDVMLQHDMDYSSVSIHSMMFDSHYRKSMSYGSPDGVSKVPAVESKQSAL